MEQWGGVKRKRKRKREGKERREGGKGTVVLSNLRNW